MSLRELFRNRHDVFEERCLDAFESTPFVNPERVSLNWYLRRHLAVMHSP